jgi:hypothetical protein
VPCPGACRGPVSRRARYRCPLGLMRLRMSPGQLRGHGVAALQPAQREDPWPPSWPGQRRCATSRPDRRAPGAAHVPAPAQSPCSRVGSVGWCGRHVAPAAPTGRRGTEQFLDTQQAGTALRAGGLRLMGLGDIDRESPQQNIGHPVRDGGQRQRLGARVGHRSGLSTAWTRVATTRAQPPECVQHPRAQSGR